MSSQFGLDDMEALFWGPSTLMADPMQSLMDPDDMMAAPSEEAASSPLSSLSSPSSSSHFSSTPSPPSSPTPLLDDKVGGALLPLAWPPADHVAPSDTKEDAFSGMDWMAEPMDLTDFDLDSFISSCGPDDPPSSPEELLSSLDSLEAQLPIAPTVPTTTAAAAVSAIVTTTSLEVTPVPEMQAELEIKTEPPSPVPSPSVLPPPSPDVMLELGSEVDVCDAKPITITTTTATAMTAVSPQQQQVSRIVLSLSPTRIVLLLAPPKQEVGIAPPPSCAVAAAVKMAAVSSPSSITKHYQASSSTRTRPYPVPSQLPLGRTTTRPKPGPAPVLVVPAAAAVAAAAASSSAPAPSSAAPQVVSKGRSRVVEKKQRKMEQNKTAATRYRQKKRVEQESLHEECSRLEERNQELAEKADSITKEIQYLKELMEEVRVAKQRKAQA